MSCVLDTNVLIYFLDDALEGSTLQRVEQAMRASARVSVITRMEVLGWRGHTENSRASARLLLDQLDEIALTSRWSSTSSKFVPALRSSCPVPSSPPAP